jgi:DNA processing protein
MSAAARSSISCAACEQCRRRSWLLAELGGVLDCNCRADGRLHDLLALTDEDLIAALGGRRRAALRAAYSLAGSQQPARSDGVLAVCRHDSRFPSSLRETGAARTLQVSGGLERLRELTERPVVAFLGRGASSDYGAAIAASLGRGLALSGVTVAGELANTIGATALRAALDAEMPALGAVAGGLAVGVPARRRELCRRLANLGCVISELPGHAPRRRWSAVGCERVLASLATVVLVVEADDSASGLSGATIAKAFDRVVAAVPGRVSSRAARGPNALLRDGARLITCAADVLDLLCVSEGRVAPARHPTQRPALEPRLRRVLERVGAGCDTPARLLAGAADSEAGDVLRSLGELELLGLLVRGDGGRYLPSDPLAP